MTTFGTEVQNTLVKIPIALTGDWPWPQRSTLTLKSKCTSCRACPHNNSSPALAKITKFGLEVEKYIGLKEPYFFVFLFLLIYSFILCVWGWGVGVGGWGVGGGGWGWGGWLTLTFKSKFHYAWVNSLATWKIYNGHDYLDCLMVPTVTVSTLYMYTDLGSRDNFGF